MTSISVLTAEAMGRRRRRSAWPVALSLVLFFITEVESFHAKNSAKLSLFLLVNGLIEWTYYYYVLAGILLYVSLALYEEEMPEQSLLKAQKPPGGVRGGGSNNGASAGDGSNERGGNPRGSSSSPYGKVIPIVGGAAVAARNNHHKGNAYCFSCCNHHFPFVFLITLLSAVVLAYD